LDANINQFRENGKSDDTSSWSNQSVIIENRFYLLNMFDYWLRGKIGGGGGGGGQVMEFVIGLMKSVI